MANLLFGFISFLTGRDNVVCDKEKEYSFSQEYKVSSLENLNVKISGGNIKVLGCRDDSVKIIYIVKKNGTILNIGYDDLKKIADFDIISSDSTLQINLRKLNEVGLDVSFSLRVPSKTNCNLNTGGGNIIMGNLLGNHNIVSSGGNLIFESITGKVTARISGGNIVMKKSEIDANVTVGGGNIVLDSISGDISAQTGGGNIKADITGINSKIVLKSGGGNILAIIPSTGGLDLNILGNQIIAELNNFTGISKENMIQGKMGAGGKKVDISTSGGKIVLNFK